MKLMTILPGVAACLLLAFACDNKNANTTPSSVLPIGWGEQNDTIPAPEQNDTVTTPAGPGVTPPAGWTDVSADYGELPDYVHIFRAPETLQGRKAVAFIADVDLSKQSFSVWGIRDVGTQGTTDSYQTPSQVYNSKGKPAVVINGGYFFTDSGKNYAASLAVNAGELLSTNINYASKDWVDVYAPTRAVFLEHADSTFEAAWSYYASKASHWVYQVPAANSYTNKPLQTPNSNFPAKGTKFEAVNGIGGGPVLLKGGEIKNTYIEEMFDSGGINPTNPNNPRTAIGVTSDKHLILFACEGREQTPEVTGFTTAELAEILKACGCTDAINLDGGGSTMMLVNGKELFKPSDGKQRSVGSCVYIK